MPSQRYSAIDTVRAVIVAVRDRTGYSYVPPAEPKLSEYWAEDSGTPSPEDMSRRLTISWEILCR